MYKEHEQWKREHAFELHVAHGISDALAEAFEEFGQYIKDPEKIEELKKTDSEAARGFEVLRRAILKEVVKNLKDPQKMEAIDPEDLKLYQELQEGMTERERRIHK